MDETIITKRCSKCKKIKSFIEFYKHSNTKDGYRLECKKCTLKQQKIYHQSEDGEKVYNRRIQTEQYKKLKKKNDKKYSLTVKGRLARKRARAKYQAKEPVKEMRRKRRRLWQQSEKGKQVYKLYREQYPDRIAARSAVHKAIQSNRLPQPGTKKCKCGKQAQEYHHVSYEKADWLKVIPFCYICHKGIHHDILIQQTGASSCFLGHSNAS